ncbi:MAG TPA: type II secretion system protein [Candidatus Saccharimonadales bacterium]|nr:type II secretion system protein [Candidatus Saccharimonadales bacterium]
MLNKIKSARSEGFTIIEVMIVLAIAGVILLIVFLAIPAVERNSRNTQRKNDVASLLGAINEYVTNNNGADPLTCSGTNPVTFGSSPAATADAATSYFNKVACSSGAATTTSGGVGILNVPVGGAAAPSASAAQDYVNIYIGGTCDATTPGKVNAGSSRAVAAQYQIETGVGKYAGACQAS